MSSSHLPDVPLLKGRANYPLWASCMKMALEAEELWSYCDPMEPPSDGLDGVEQYRRAIGLGLAITFICANCVPIISRSVADWTNPRELWIHLQQRYDHPGPYTRYIAFRDWLNIDREHGYVEDFCTKYSEELAALEFHEMNLSAEFAAYHFICKMDVFYPEYDTVLKEDIRRDETTKNVGALIARVRAEYQRRLS